MSGPIIEQNLDGKSFLRLMVFVSFTPFFLLIDPALPLPNYYLAAFALIYFVGLYLSPRLENVLNKRLPLTDIIDLGIIALLILFNEKYMLALSMFFILPIIRLSFHGRQLKPLLLLLGISVFYLAIGLLKQSDYLLLMIIQVVLFFILFFYTSNLVKFSLQNYYQQAYQDTLTKIHNRRYFNHMLTQMVREKIPFCLVLLDLDNFKSLNDTQGHQHGDYVLKVIALIQKDCTRSYDIVARFGGDEFAIILPRQSKEVCRNIAERIRANVLANPKLLSYPDITISIGIAAFPEDASTEEGILQKADEALYKAKDKGKNNVHIYQSI
ncbi:MAG: GGDEF domain-containing protein [Clostridia bacterium]|jgi:diguanylate cyclase (GGDEF)-like protein|nr:GGDEF domain-containing protein [Clostridia bacterium]